MKLTVLERLTLLGSLPEKGDFTTLRIVRKLREDLSFAEEEHERLELKQQDGRISWNPVVDGDGKEVEIGEKANDVVVESLKKLDKEKQLTAQHISLCEKFLKD